MHVDEGNYTWKYLQDTVTGLSFLPTISHDYCFPVYNLVIKGYEIINKSMEASPLGFTDASSVQISAHTAAHVLNQKYHTTSCGYKKKGKNLHQITFSRFSSSFNIGVTRVLL